MRQVIEIQNDLANTGQLTILLELKGRNRVMESTPSRGLNRVHLQCRNLQEFLGGLSPGVLDRLYGHPATCLAVFRELPSLAKNWVMRMLFLEQPLPQAAVALWVKKEFSKAQEESTGLLSGLRIWHTQLLPGGLQGLILNPIFRQNLRIALLGGGKAWSDDTSQLGPDKHARDVPSLDKYAEERWEVVLHFMVGSPSAAVSQDLAQLLSQAGLMKSTEPGEPPCITSAGFQFLLLDTPAQLWYFMLQYLQTAQSRGMDLVEILSFLFQLSFSTLGKDYSVEGMSDSLLNFLQHLQEISALLPHTPGHQSLIRCLWSWGHCASARFHCRGNQLPTVCLHGVGAADCPHCPLL
uniref:General transcription factor IIH subunit 4 n=2 Tax=Pan TaxID=9596 RepID=A0A2I3T3L1_PANTR